MKRFTFSLETVLQYRSRQEQDAVLEQAKAQARRLAKEGALAETKSTLAQILAGGPGVTMAELLHSSFYQMRLNALAVEQAAEAAEATREWAVCREHTLVRHRERKVLEKLKQKKESEFWRQVAVWEEKENDELSLRLHASRQNRL